MSLRIGNRGSAVRQLQADLKQLGLLSSNPTGYFGTRTKAAVQRYERAHHLRVDGFVSNTERNQIHWFAALATPHAKASPHPTDGAPPEDYRHVSFRGVTVDQRTVTMIERAEAKMHALGVSGRISLSQGSFHHNPSSGSTHDGGGAVDIRVGGRSLTQRRLMVKALREAGFAAWNRFPADGFPNHIHAIAIGDQRMSAGARSQVAQYFRGRNGLSNHGPDKDASVGRPYPGWAAKYR